MGPRTAVLVVGVLFSCIQSSAQDCARLVDRFDQWEARVITVAGDLALIGGGTTLSLVDIGAVARPEHLGAVELPGQAFAIAVDGDLALVAHEPEAGVSVVDISDPESPDLIGFWPTSGYVRDLALVGEKAVLLDRACDGADGFLVVLDVSDPLDPTSPGSREAPALAEVIAANHAAVCVPRFGELNVFGFSESGSLPLIHVEELIYYEKAYPSDVAVVGDLLYVPTTERVGSYYFSRLSIFRLWADGTLIEAGSIRLPGDSWGTGRVAVSPEGLAAVGYHGEYLFIDARIPGAAHEVGALAIDEDSVAFSGGHLLVAEGESTVFQSACEYVWPSPWSELAVYDVSPCVGEVPKAAFGWTPDRPAPSSQVVFTNASTGFPNWYHWDFGDGTTSKRRNPTHRYARAGVYTATLTAGNAVGARTISKELQVQTASPRRPSGRAEGP